MTDDVSRRDLKRDVERLKSQEDHFTTAAFQLEDGTYVDKDGNPISDWSPVIFVIPPELWQSWGSDKFDLGINTTGE